MELENVVARGINATQWEVLINGRRVGVVTRLFKDGRGLWVATFGECGRCEFRTKGEAVYSLVKCWEEGKV